MVGILLFSYEWNIGVMIQSIVLDGSGLYCVIVIDVLGCSFIVCYDVFGGNGLDFICVVNLIFILIVVGLEIEVFVYGLGVIDYFWSIGEVIFFIEVIEVGIYCVIIMDVEGCEVMACVDYFLILCGVSIEIGVWGMELQVFLEGVVFFVYNWNMGFIFFLIDIDLNVNFYFVIVIDVVGCMAMVIYWYQGGIDFCFVEIIIVQNGMMLEVVVFGVIGVVIYNWSIGVIIVIIQDVEFGNYCVIIMIDDGCIFMDCIFIINFLVFFIIDGYVYLFDSINGGEMEGWVYLIVYDEEEGIFMAVDIMEMESLGFEGVVYYKFDVQFVGEYLIKVVLVFGMNGYENYLLIYYSYVFWWDEVNMVILLFNGWGFFNFILIFGDNFGGLGFIGGYVVDGVNL